jgi:hypothetical protein
MHYIIHGLSSTACGSSTALTARRQLPLPSAAAWQQQRVGWPEGHQLKMLPALEKMLLLMMMMVTVLLLERQLQG